MIGYHQPGIRRQPNCSSGNSAYGLGESLGNLFHTVGRMMGGGVRMALSYRRPSGCAGCRECAPRYCDCVECRPPIYTGCCRTCGE
jgi:hypothetical protein